MELYLDCETSSDADLKAIGAYAYAEHLRTRLLIVAYAIDDAPVTAWVPNDWSPADDAFIAAFHAADRIWAHNAAFDREILAHRLGLRSDKWACSMAAAYSASLPGSLAALGAALGLPASTRKAQAGRELLKIFCLPGSSGTAESRPVEWAQFIEYARQDVATMRECLRRMPLANYNRDYSLYRLDQKINRNGMLIDRPLVDAMLRVSEIEKSRISVTVCNSTGGEVLNVTERDRLLRYLRALGTDLDDLKAATIRDLLKGDLPADIRALLELRQQGAKASSAKLQRLSDGACADGRLRGTLQFRGASRTGRWAGRVFQPHNLPRPTVPPSDARTYVAAFKAGCIGYITDRPLQAVADCLRSTIRAPAGKVLAVGDYASIEARVLAWLAGEEQVLETFRRYDGGDGADPYCTTYARSFGVPTGSVTRAQRQIGKVTELAFGYEGGVGACVTMAAAYDMDLAAIAAAVLPIAPYDVLRNAQSAYDRAVTDLRTFDLPRDQYIACDVLKQLWRKARPRTVALWSALRDAFSGVALGSNGQQIGMLGVEKFGDYTAITLPSGRSLLYWYPQVHRAGASFMGTGHGGPWTRQSTYGGKLVENVTQAVAADLLGHHLQGVDADHRFDIVLHVHDEIVAETAPGSAPTLAQIMRAPPAWADGLPLAVAAYECINYSKE